MAKSRKSVAVDAFPPESSDSAKFISKASINSKLKKMTAGKLARASGDDEVPGDLGREAVDTTDAETVAVSPKHEGVEVFQYAWPKKLTIYTDGASRGNPGPSSIGVYVIDRNGALIFEHGEKLGNQTNNFAEYTALIRALELALKNEANDIIIRADSELMIRQMLGIYKVKSPAIVPLHQRCKELSKKFEKVKYEHVRREANVEADRLANQALDRR
jgi:ribonuclease HI